MTNGGQPHISQSVKKDRGVKAVNPWNRPDLQEQAVHTLLSNLRRESSEPARDSRSRPLPTAFQAVSSIDGKLLRSFRYLVTRPAR